MANLNEVVNSVIANLNEQQQQKLLHAYIAQETEKKFSEIEKNYKDDVKKDFAVKNIIGNMTQRLLKKVSLIEMKVAYEASKAQ